MVKQLQICNDEGHHELTNLNIIQTLNDRNFSYTKNYNVYLFKIIQTKFYCILINKKN